MRVLAFVCCATLSFGATTTTWEMTGYQDFLRGRLNGLSLTRDGRLVVGPKIETVFSSDQPDIWSVAQAPDGSLYLGTGNRGRLYKVDASGQSTLVWSADQPEIFAVTVDTKGVVYAGSSPDGKVYRIENGKATEYFSPGAKYIWALKVGSDGSLFVATGDQGKIFRVTAAGRGDVYYDTGQTHVTCLAFDREGRLLAGSDPNGILYRISAQNKAFVLYDANLPEIRAIVPGADGSIYAAALGGSVARRIGAAANSANGGTPAVVAPAMSITVTDAQGGINPAPKIEAPKATVTTTPATVVTTTPTVEYSGVDKSALYKINPDNTVETLWSSKDENAYDLAFSGNELVFVTDAQGRIYRLDRDRKTTLIAQANEGEATRLLESKSGLIAATADLGKILKLSAAAGSTGTFESPVHDSGSVARWGRIIWRGDGASFQTRTGNSLRPDATWSDWSAPINDLAHSAITSPNARYIQWRAELSRSGAAIEDVTVAYVPQNTPPVLRSINVTTQAGAAKAASPSSAPANASYSITVTDSGDSSTPAGTQAQTLSRATGQQIQVSWQADDPDGDHLIYNLYFRGEDEHDWKLLRANMSENAYLLDGDVFADGRYYFKVTASDRPSNPIEYAREAELVSAPVLIDNTPPMVTAGAPRRNGGTLEIDVDAEDRGSVLRRCEYSIDAGPWSPVEAADGVTDSAREQFKIRITDLPAAEHLIVIRAFDAAGNAGLTKVVVR
jgi:sugar lactone lactonase YvrE